MNQTHHPRSTPAQAMSAGPAAPVAPAASLSAALATFATLATLALLGCASVGPDYAGPGPATPAAEPPAQYLAASGSAAPQSLWPTLLQDPVLQRLDQATLQTNPDLAVALARLAQARAQQGVQESATGPTVNASLGQSADRLSKNSELFANAPPVQNLKTHFVNTQIGFDASWEIDLFGYQRRLSEAAQARTQGVQERAQDLRLSLRAEVARNYYELRTWQARQRIAQSQLADLDSQLTMLQAAVQQGEVAAQELARLHNQRDNLAASLPNLALGERQNLLALHVLSTVPLAELAPLLQTAQPLPEVPAAPAAGLPGDLLKQRPDVRAAERDWAAASADVGVATAAQYPRLLLLGTGGWQSVHSGQLVDAASHFWNIGPKLSLPIFNSGRLQGQVQANQAALEAAQASYRKTVLAAVADAELALTRLASTEQRRSQLQNAQAQQEALYRSAQAQYAAGAISKLTLVEAHRQLAVQQDQTVQAQGQSLTAVVGVVKALGG